MADENSSGYLTGKEDVITSFAGIYPKSNPQIIIYASASRPTNASQKPLSNAVKEIVNNNYNAFVNEIVLLNNEIVNMNIIDTGKKYNLTTTIRQYEKYKEELFELYKVFNDSKIDYAKRISILLSLRISYQIRNELPKNMFNLKENGENIKKMENNRW